MSIESQHASIKTEKNKKFKINARKEKKKGYKKNPSFMIKKKWALFLNQYVVMFFS